MTSENNQQHYQFPSLFSPQLNFNYSSLFNQNVIQSNNTNNIQLVDTNGNDIIHNNNNTVDNTFNSATTPSQLPAESCVSENTAATLSIAKEEAINNLWNNFQRVATNLSHLVAEERKRVPHEGQEDFLRLWPLFHDTASSLTSFYEEAISVFAKGLEFGIEHGRILEKKEQPIRVKKAKSKSKRELNTTLLFDKQPLQQNETCQFSSDEQVQNVTNPTAKFHTIQSSPCPNCGYSLQKTHSRSQSHSIDNGQLVESNRKRNNISYEEIPMETSIPKKAKFL